MSDFNVCKNGHRYQSSQSECPYCPKSNYIEETIGLPNLQQQDTESTQSFRPVQTGPSSERTQIFSASPGNPSMPKDTGHKRKLVGWLVTYSHSETGQDHKLFEGRNLVGSGKNCDIMFGNDTSISSHHFTILYRLGEFLFKDELSTNGTFINGVLTNEGQLKDGDEIKVGNTLLLFRKSFK